MLFGSFTTVRIKSEETKRRKLVLLMATSSLALLSELLEIQKSFLFQSVVILLCR